MKNQIFDILLGIFQRNQMKREVILKYLIYTP